MTADDLAFFIVGFLLLSLIGALIAPAEKKPPVGQTKASS